MQKDVPIPIYLKQRVGRMLTFENRQKLRHDEDVIAGPNASLLTECQLDAVLCAQDGMRDKEIAFTMGIAHRTVVTLLERARETIGAKNRAHLISLSFQKGVIAVHREWQSGKATVTTLFINFFVGLALMVSIFTADIEQRRPRSQSNLVKVVRQCGRSMGRAKARRAGRKKEDQIIAGVALDF